MHSFSLLEDSVVTWFANNCCCRFWSTKGASNSFCHVHGSPSASHTKSPPVEDQAEEEEEQGGISHIVGTIVEVVDVETFVLHCDRGWWWNNRVSGVFYISILILFCLNNTRFYSYRFSWRTQNDLVGVQYFTRLGWSMILWFVYFCLVLWSLTAILFFSSLRCKEASIGCLLSTITLSSTELLIPAHPINYLYFREKGKKMKKIKSSIVL